MDCDEPERALMTPEAFEQQLWPQIVEQERHYRRTDRLFLAASVLGLVFVSMGAATMTSNTVLRGIVIGFLGPIGVNIGVAWQRMLNRRAGYRTLEQLHQEAERILIARELES